jgi:hypothetical protein
MSPHCRLTPPVSGRRPNETVRLKQIRKRAAVPRTASLGFCLSPPLSTGENAAGETLLPSLFRRRALNFGQNHERGLLPFIHGVVACPTRRHPPMDHGPRTEDQPYPSLCRG